MIGNHLILPVLARAKAHDDGVFGNFSDRFAHSVLNAFSYHSPISNFRLNLRQHISRCSWIDERIARCLTSYPDAHTVEINGGLSTRFYRLSERIEWPRFSWTSVNNETDNDYLQKVFPATDNFVNVACEHPNTGWLRHVSINKSQKQLFIFAENTPLQSATELTEILACLVALSRNYNIEVDVIICHRINHIQSTLSLLQAPIKVLSVFETRKQSIVKALYPFSNKFSKKYSAHHILINVNSMELKI